MTKEKWYKSIFGFLNPLRSLVYPMTVTGRENIPDGPVLICANHSNAPDPVLIVYAMGWKKYYTHILAKAEARKIPFVRLLMKKIGTIFVHRGEKDIQAYKSCLRVLQSGEKLLVFPEGTRVHGDRRVPPKSGVIHMAAKTHVPILPVYLPRDKKLFHRIRVVIGKPYTVEVSSREDYDRLAEELMERILALKE